MWKKYRRKDDSIFTPLREKTNRQTGRDRQDDEDGRTEGDERRQADKQSW